MPWDQRIKSRLKLRDLEILITVIQAGSMGKAADLLGTFQPTISKAIADLEATLGVRLFERGPQGVEPTPYAMALATRSTAAFNELRQAVQDIDNLADPAAGELRIAGSAPIVSGLFPAVIDSLSRQYPRLVFHVTQVFTDPDRYRALREREVEFIVGRLPRLESQEDLKVDWLMADPLCVAAGESSPWVRRRSIELEELVDEPWVLFPPDIFLGRLHTELFQSCGLERPRNGVLCGSLHMSDTLLATGRYLAVYSRSRLLLNGKQLSIKILPVELPAQKSRVGIVTLKNRPLSPVAALFIQRMREIVGTLQK